MSVLLISPAGTGGWRANEAAISASLDRLGVSHEVRRVELGRLERLRHPWASGSLLVAAAARRELRLALEEETPAALIAVNPTAAMLLPFRRLRTRGIRVATRIDCPAAEQFPGAAHAPHRWLERRALRRAELALTMGPRSTEAVRPLARAVSELPIGIEVEPASEPAWPPVVVAYAGQPKFKGLDRIVAAWERLGERRGEAVLAITGTDAAAGRAFLAKRGSPEPEGIDWAEPLPRARYVELVRSATAFLSASRIEGHGIAQLEALGWGVPLVTSGSRGAYEAEPIARALAPELVSSPAAEPLADAISAALAMSPSRRADYARRAAELVAPYALERVDPALSDALSALGVPVPTGGQSQRRSAG